MRVDLRLKHDVEARKAAIELFERGHGHKSAAATLSIPRNTVAQWLYIYPRVRKRGTAAYGREAGQVHIRVEGRRRVGRRRRRHGEAGRHARVRGHVPGAAGEMVQALPRERLRCAQAQAQGQAEGVRLRTARADARAGARDSRAQARGRGRLPKKIARLGRGGRALTRAKAEAVSALRAEGHELGHLLECAGLPRSSCYYALSHPGRPTRPGLREAVAEIFSRTANGCGHRQIAMCLRGELGAVIADKTVLKR